MAIAGVRIKRLERSGLKRRPNCQIWMLASDADGACTVPVVLDLGILAVSFEINHIE